MKKEIERTLIKMVFFRRDLMKLIKPFLPSNISIKNIPPFCRKNQFITFLQQSDINVEKEEEENKNKEDHQIYIKQIIEEDKVELLQKETEKENNMNIIIEDSFLELENMEIPILHYCIMKKAIKCFKFLILNGANPSLTLQYQLTIDEYDEYKYEWDCMAVGAYFGEIEMMRILEERGINKLNNPNVWEAVTLSHRNQFLHLFISRKDEIPNFEECLRKGLKGSVKGNNLKAFKLLISKGADIDAKDIIHQNIQ